ncbi:hypothetical protein ACR0ST_03585 [Aliidiomarina sp. Khilg15.8]
MHNLLRIVMAFLLLGSCWFSAEAADFELSGPSEKVAEGYFYLEVDGLQEDQRFVVEMSHDQDFSMVAREFEPLGMFRELSLSGFDDGTYYFRARSGERYSNVVAVTVSHYSLWQALFLFTLGLIIFATLVYTIVYFYRRSDGEGT